MSTSSPHHIVAEEAHASAKSPLPKQSAPASPLRIGVLGAARITDVAVIQPTHELGYRLVSLAARDFSRAERYASRHGFEKVLPSYQAVIDDPAVEVVYNPLPNALHGPWNIRAIEAGKHVLSEKPFASNAREAQRVRDAAAAAGVLVIEAFHHEYHPMTARMLALATDGTIGTLQHIDIHMLMPPPAAGDPRWELQMAGGSLMDLGCYAVQVLRDLAQRTGAEPQVMSARAVQLERFPGVDASMSADLLLPGGVTAHFESSMAHAVVDSSWRMVGTRGEAFAPSFNKAQLDDRIIITEGLTRKTEYLGRLTTYRYMMQALHSLLRKGTPMRTDADQAVANMQVIDQLYRAAGMSPRPEQTP